jgi:hypothetical protein
LTARVGPIIHVPSVAHPAALLAKVSRKYTVGPPAEAMPMHLLAEHVSPVVHVMPSLHAAPSAAGTMTHPPVALQVPVLHGSPV